MFAITQLSKGGTHLLPQTETVELPGHNPPQRQYLHKFGKRSAIVVYVEAESGAVRSLIYSSHKKADKFLKNKRGR